jgi:hypothetical protein
MSTEQRIIPGLAASIPFLRLLSIMTIQSSQTEQIPISSTSTPLSIAMAIAVNISRAEYMITLLIKPEGLVRTSSKLVKTQSLPASFQPYLYTKQGAYLPP